MHWSDEQRMKVAVSPKISAALPQNGHGTNTGLIFSSVIFFSTK
jgi:hypothetical protein